MLNEDRDSPSEGIEHNQLAGHARYSPSLLQGVTKPMPSPSSSSAAAAAPPPAPAGEVGSVSLAVLGSWAVP